MYTVLLPVGEEERQATKAANAVRSFPLVQDDLRIVVLNVFQEFEASDEGEHISSDEFYSEDDFPDSVDVVTSLLEEDGITVEWRREHGDAGDEILRIAEEIDAGSILMSGRRRSPTGKALFGSVTQYVLLNAEQPVITAMVD